MKPDYKNWMPKGMVLGTLCGAIGCIGASAICHYTDLIKNETGRNVISGSLLFAGVMAGGAALWMAKMYQAFSYDGKRKMSRQIIEGIADHVKLRAGCKGLDIKTPTLIQFNYSTAAYLQAG